MTSTPSAWCGVPAGATGSPAPVVTGRGIYSPKHLRPARGRRSAGVSGSCPVFPVSQGRSEPGLVVEATRGANRGGLHRIPTGVFVGLLMAVLAALLLLAMRFDPMVDGQDGSHAGHGWRTASAALPGMPVVQAQSVRHSPRREAAAAVQTAALDNLENADSRATPPENARLSEPPEGSTPCTP